MEGLGYILELLFCRVSGDRCRIRFVGESSGLYATGIRVHRTHRAECGAPLM